MMTNGGKIKCVYYNKSHALRYIADSYNHNAPLRMQGKIYIITCNDNIKIKILCDRIMMPHLCETTGCDAVACAADAAGLGGTSRVVGGTLAMPPFLSPAAAACILVSLDVT